jgi:hypothetical protein
VCTIFLGSAGTSGHDNLDFMHAVQVYLNAFAGVSMYSVREGFRSIGVEDNQILVFPRLMDSKSLFLTASHQLVDDHLVACCYQMAEEGR